jgi:hypothetical protein
MFVGCCIHDMLLAACPWRTRGEPFSIVKAMMDHLLSLHASKPTFALVYDAACGLARSLKHQDRVR